MTSISSCLSEKNNILTNRHFDLIEDSGPAIFAPTDEAPLPFTGLVSDEKSAVALTVGICPGGASLSLAAL